MAGAKLLRRPPDLRGTIFGVLLCVTIWLQPVDSVILTPPYFNLAEGRRITASATCGVDTEGPELYCKLVGANAENDVHINVIQGQYCDYCDPARPEKMHLPEYAVDGMETWWQSPPLSRGMKYNEVNLTIDLGQEFHVAYVYVRMGNSPRPGLWILEKSSDYGKTFTPWQYFSDSAADCVAYFGKESLQPITTDDSVICNTEYSKIVPLEGGEIPISLLNNRPSANMYFNSSVLQEWTRATNVRLRLLRTKNLLGHLMSVARQDHTVTRRYFYSIKDISIGGRCMCNGHADTCDIQDPQDPKKLLCRCQHHTCGPQCANCCSGFEQKKWRISKAYKKFECEPCNCFNHTTECKYDPEIDAQHQSLDIHGNYDGGGVCENCQHNTEGINCNRCKPTFYRPYGKKWYDLDVCQPCECDHFYSTGNCAEGSGQCECRREFTPPNCDACSFGYFGYPNCRPCECHLNGTDGYHCEVKGDQCPCKSNYAGMYCNQCADIFYNFPECHACECNEIGSLTPTCNQQTGNCTCKSNYRGRTCDQCEHGYYKYPTCTYCNCDISGTLPGICDKSSGRCLCKEGYGGDHCDQCVPGYYGYPNCRPCNCSDVGSATQFCDTTGKCPCLPSFAGRTCDQCSPGYFKYPECLACNCDSNGAIGVSCDSDGKCQCHHNFDNNRCDQCKEGYYNFPNCEECNCNPAGVAAAFAGCGSVPAGELCECKSRVHGRICDICRPLYWNLQLTNPDGCEPCDCYIAGVVGGIGVCDPNSGQCVCKPSVGGKKCSQCADGTYDLRHDDLFGCKDCDCDIGGSVSGVCNKSNGQCHCQPRLEGRTCREPIQTHYFPTLYQYQYEVEEARTPHNSPVRYGFEENIFPNYSWKGYAVFSPLLQNEIIQEISIQKSSLYRMVMSYVNSNPDTVTGTVTIVPDNPSDIEQKFEVQFKPTKNPSFVTVTSPLVMNPGRWHVNIKAKKSLYLDYFVLLPQAFYEAAILSQKVETACRIGQDGLCRHYSYPDISKFDAAHGDGGFIVHGEYKESLTDFYTEQHQLSELGVNSLAVLGGDQKEFSLNLTVTKPGQYVLLVTYATPISLTSEEDEEEFETHVVEIVHEDGTEKGNYLVNLAPCPYTTLCRQVVTDGSKRIAHFHFNSNYNTLTLKGDDNVYLGIKSIVAIPYHEWSLDYIRPKSVCVRKDGKCVPAQFPIAPDSKRVKFEVGNEQQIAQERPPNIYNTTSNLIFLDYNNAMVDIKSKVPHPGYYVFVVHYYQPDYPEFDMDVLIQNGQFYEAKLPLRHCPSNSGCRAIISQEGDNTRFSLTENFVLTLKEPNHKSVWLEYLLVVPAELYLDHILSEENFDQTGEFITTCAGNHFYINTSTEGFCKDAVFSLTSNYNDGALPCVCEFAGSLSFKCEKFGGQCPCKPNVIGRQCVLCKTGYYGYPNCKPCHCPSTALCETETGQCICPPRVTGEKCNQCAPYTFGFDQIIGCEECNCNPLGVLNDLQCDLFTGSCTCKENIEGRTCDQCYRGHYAFPYCEKCRCDIKGTTIDICDPNNAECLCKLHVLGPECNFCIDGTFNLQEDNEEGCTKCFCFSKTTRCISSSLYRTQIGGMNNWTLLSIIEGNNMSVILLDEEVEQINFSTVSVDLSESESEEQITYFSAPLQFLGNQLTSYGGFLNYSIYYTISSGGGAVSGADVILYGADTYLLHDAVEQPAADLEYNAGLELVERNFVLANGLPANREHLMVVLQDLRGIYIRTTYWETGIHTRLSEVSLDTATDEYLSDAPQASSVEKCQCPPNYKGLSCEECAPGYWRATPDYCAPCQCNDHSNKCDVNTGICIECEHSTRGDHCEQCEIGYHGNALHGTPMDCLICACPLPLASNNFATGCEVSPSGEEISCDCRPGYYGARCQSCAAGFYGEPEIQGQFCSPCNCSGNINPYELGSCDSVTGECLRCLNNTYGAACSLCAPGYYGDAIISKNCQSCVCDRVGTERCDSYTGLCECLPNVTGIKCETCFENHYGFTSGRGCWPCECQEASESTQCDDATGQCRCRSGVTGRACDRCAPGFWNYTPQGCVSCGCNTEYSLGFGCNAQTGQCECLQGVMGEKCDHCPYRWVLILNQGCFECDSCTHDLLDTTDQLRELIDPVIIEFEAVASGYFTSRRLTYINSTYNQLKPLVEALDVNETNVLAPVLSQLEGAEAESKNLNRRANFSLGTAQNIAPESSELRKKALEVLNAIRLAAINVNKTVQDVDELTFDTGEGPKIDQALLEADYILKEIRKYDLSEREKEAMQQLEKARKVLEDVKEFQEPVMEQDKEWFDIKSEMKIFKNKLNSLTNYTTFAHGRISEAEGLKTKNRSDIVYKKLNTVEELFENAEADLKEGTNLLRNTSRSLIQTNRTANELLDGMEDFNELMNEFRNNIISDNDTIELQNMVVQAGEHASSLRNNAQYLDHILSDTRSISGSAVGAANAYRDIVTAIESAQEAAENALKAANITNSLLDGLEDKTIESERNATELLKEANLTLYYAETDLKPQLEEAGIQIEKIETLSNHSENEYKKIIDALNRLDDQNLADVSEEAIEIAHEANNQAQEALSIISSIAGNSENDLQQAKQLQKDSEDTKRNIQQAQIQLNSINTILPNITNLIDEIAPQQALLQNVVTDIEDKINRLNHQINIARELANRVKIGVTFFPNTTLELKNPPDLADQATSTHASVYFKTEKPNGFMLYLGNAPGTKLRRTKSDDYMALEIENGYPVLTMDIGNGPERIISKKYVADGNWYQAVIDRTGHNARLTVREETPDRTVEEYVSEEALEGTNTIFNLDQDQSRLFVGGYPASFEIQNAVRHSSFDGQMEELVIGEHHVGLWNFKDAEENYVGAEQRDKLINLQPSTGFRFNGNGYAILDARPHSLRSRTELRLTFKTSAPEGLMFLAGNADAEKFMSVEMRGGKVFYQYDLGEGVVTLHSKKQYNDGNWHSIKASRDAQKGVLEIDFDESFTGSSTGSSKLLEVTELMFFGGYPNQHSFHYVTSTDFDGCIDDVQIMSTPIDLSQNVKAYGVLPGCPVKFATLVSFADDAPGYIRHPNATSANSFKVSMKFKTRSPNGLIFYATDRDQTAGVSLGLVNGALVFISQRLELNTSAHSRYNDDEWHVVTLTHNLYELRMDIDDLESYPADSPPVPLHIMYGDMYIGGVPPGFEVVKGAVRTVTPFSGCIGDATLNGMIINFANATDKQNDILGRCILDKSDDGDYSDLHKIPTLVKGPDKTFTEPQTTTEEPFILLTDKPTRGDGGIDDDFRPGEPITEGAPFVPYTTTVRPLFEMQVPMHTTEQEAEEESTEEPLREITTMKHMEEHTEGGFIEGYTEKEHVDEHTEKGHVDEDEFVGRPPTTSLPTADQCVLPLMPAEPANFQAGFRFGTHVASRVEYDHSRGRYKNSYDFSIEFRTTALNGLIFYVEGAQHMHFVALYLVAGKVKYLFSCGTGPVILESDHTYSDGLWHTAMFSRNQTDGKLVVDDRDVFSGHSESGTNRHLNVTPPFYLGAVPTQLESDVTVNLIAYQPFEGCLRNFHMNGKPMQNPRIEGAVPCSDNIESGIFFGVADGYVRLRERFKVGAEIDIQMDIKPRNISGLLMSVHGKRDFLVLQMVDGVIKFSVDNGKGPIEATFVPKDKFYFCDGQWHTIQAIKSKNVVSLSVDKIFADAGVGQSHSTDTRFSLFLGGHQHLHQKRLRGIQTRSSFVGCIKELHINNRAFPITANMTTGDVTVGVCPTN